MKIGEGMVSRVYLNDGKVSKRYFTPFDKYPGRAIEDHWEKEVKALEKLSGKTHFPELLSVNDTKKIIYMSYCGESLTKENLPDDWRKQCEQIEKICKEFSVYHQDFVGSDANPIPPHNKNILVKDGIIYLVDFGIWSKVKSPFTNTITSIIRKVYNGKTAN